MNQKYFAELKKNVQNVNWKKEMKMDLINNSLPRVLPPEPYCSRERGAVIGRCNYIKQNCIGSSIPVAPECKCNYHTGKIEKCSKYSRSTDLKINLP
jgi:hypothetical protein